jgi:hypothetical protein
MDKIELLNREFQTHLDIANYALNQLGLQRLVENGVTKLCNNIRSEIVGEALKKCLKASSVKLIETDRGMVMSKAEFSSPNISCLTRKVWIK